MALISSNEYLTRSQMRDNASYVHNFFTKLGWTSNAICGMLGNMERESTLNPGLWESLDYENYSVGFGLVQWTPATNLTDWASKKGLARGSIETQCKKIQDEYETGGQYYATPEYPLTFYQFSKSTESPEYLARAFCKNYERAGVEAMSERESNARYWYNQLTYYPRLKEVDEYWGPIRGSKYYYSENIFYQSGYGLPNCTCYAWGIRYELTDQKPTTYTGDACGWYQYNKDNNIYPYSDSIPSLGAIACWSDSSKPEGQGGHVAIVEEIDPSTGNITTSNSAYGSTFFYVDTLQQSQGYNNGRYRFQGFIYLKDGYVPPTLNPEITNIESISSTKIKISGVSNGSEQVVLYIKWNSNSVSMSDYDEIITTNSSTFTIDVAKPREASSVAVIPVRGIYIGSVFAKDGLIVSIPCINIYTDNHFLQAIPYVYTNGQWKKSVPMLYTKGQWFKIYNDKK